MKDKLLLNYINLTQLLFIKASLSMHLENTGLQQDNLSTIEKKTLSSEP